MIDIKKIVIAGAGLMGTSMAQIFGKHGYDVVIYDLVPEALETSKNLIKINQDEQVKMGEITVEESNKIKAAMSHTTDKAIFKSCDMVVESIVEKLEIKQKFWEEISRIVPEKAILATNTSGLSITAIAEGIYKPERFCGMHWFNPAHLIPLIEVIKGDKSSDEVCEIVYDISLEIGKEPIHVKKDALGFVGNRIQLAILREAIYIVEQGISSFEDVDKAMKYALGFRYACLGPFEVCDFGGLDTFYHIQTYLNQDLCDIKEPQKTLKNLYLNQEFGVKSKKGFYDYSGGKDEEAIRKRDELYMKVSKLLK